MVLKVHNCSKVTDSQTYDYQFATHLTRKSICRWSDVGVSGRSVPPHCRPNIVLRENRANCRAIVILQLIKNEFLIDTVENMKSGVMTLSKVTIVWLDLHSYETEDLLENLILHRFKPLCHDVWRQELVICHLAAALLSCPGMGTTKCGLLIIIGI